ncbi:MAG: DUF420 domain-containing protein [bacterium]|nr:DUF420 domain-containing protein [bacterium]
MTTAESNSRRFSIVVVLSAAVVALAVLAVLNMGPGGSGGHVAAGSMSARPLLHARLNALSAVILITGLVFIRRGMIRTHMTCMILAALTTVTFLVSYLQYHYFAGSVSFQGQGWVRPVYFAILLTHTVLAAFVAPLAASLFWYAARGRRARHRRIARFTLPMWLYVSVTGVLIYCMLYLWFPST